MATRRPSGGGLLELGRALAVEGVLARISLGIGVAIVLGGLVTVIAVARGDHSDNLANLPLLTSSALAWGAGTLLAFAAAAHAFRRDRENGIRALVSARARSDAEYLWARVIGLARALAWVTVSGTVIVGAAAALAARGGALAIRTLESTGASVAFSFLFAATLAPVALATLGARTRIGGYLALLFVLVLPELLSGWLSTALPEGWGELASIPGALGALRGSLLPAGLDPLRGSRALAILLLVVVLAMLVARGQLARFDREPAS
jgi:hypothetical protein